MRKTFSLLVCAVLAAGILCLGSCTFQQEAGGVFPGLSTTVSTDGSALPEISVPESENSSLSGTQPGSQSDTASSGQNSSRVSSATVISQKDVLDYPGIHPEPDGID